MKRLLLLVALLCPAIGVFAQTATLTSSSANYSASGGTLTLTAGIDYSTASAPTALGFKITLPANWTLADDGSGSARIGGTNIPNTSPSAGTGPILDFAYSSFPANRVSFVVVVNYPAGLSGTQQITASAIYRTPLVEPTIAPLNITSATDAAPLITTHPTSQNGNAGQSVTFTAAASGNPAPTFQWQKGGVDIPNAIGPSYTIANVTSGSAGSYAVVATNGFGQVTSNSATLTVRSITGFTPLSAGQADTVTITGSGFTGATGVKFNGVTATSFTVVSNTQITAVVPTFATSGAITVTLADASVLTSSGSLTLSQGPRLVNLSASGTVVGGDATGSALQANFTVEGNTSKSVLVRALGPALGASGVGDPVLSIYDSTGTLVASNDNWDSSLASTFVSVGASSLSAGSKDAALVATFAPGTYTARVTSLAVNSGTSTLEVFEVAADSSRIALLARRATRGTTGFVLSGTGSKAVLIRAVGRSANPSGLFDPTLSLLGGSTVIASNDNWGTNTNVADINTATVAVGAMPLGANDSAILVTLAPGSYTVDVTNAPNTSTLGVVRTEIFLVDSFRPAAFAPALLTPLTETSGQVFQTFAFFTAPFVGKPAPTFQWQKGGADIVGQTSQALTLTNISTADAGSYRVVMTNGSGVITSASANLTVRKISPSITWSAPAAISYGTALSATQLNAAATGPDSLAIPGTFAYTPAAGTILNAGASQTLSVTFTPTDTANYDPVTATTTITVNKAAPTISWGAPAAITYGTALSGTQLNATANVAGTFVYTPASGTILNAGANQLSVTFTPTDAANYSNATGSTSITVNKAQPTVAWDTPAAITYGTLLSGTQLNATASFGGNTVAGTFAYTPAAGTKLNASANPQNLSVTFTPTDATNYNTATGATTIVVNKSNQTITFAAIPSKPRDSGNFALTATSDSGLTISYATSNPSSGTVATVSGSTVTLANTGTITITASQAGDSNYNAATPVSQVLTVLSAGQTITFAATELPAKTFGNSPFSINATARGSLTGVVTNLLVSFTSDNPGVATVGTSTLSSGVSTATVTIVGAGTANITASQPGTSDFAAAPDVIRTLTVAKAAATIVLGGLSQTYDGTPKSATATTTPSGLNVAITYTPTGGSATANAPTNAGSYAVNATISGSNPPESNYTGTATGTLVIAKAAQTINFALSSPVLINSSAITLTGNATSNLTVSYASSNTSVATVSGTTLTVKGLGTTTITASQAGDGNFNAAPDVPRTFTVNPIAPVIASTPPLSQTAIVGSNFVFGPVTLASQLAAPYTFSATGLPAGLTVNAASGNISGTPTAAPGAFTIVLTVTNATGSDSRTINLTLQPAAPVFTSAAAASGTAGTAFTYTAVASNATSYALTGTLPAGLLFNASTGVISGTPTAAGTTTVNITATNTTGSVTLPVVISIVFPANAPVYTGTLNPSGTAGVAFTFTPTFTGTVTAYALTGTLPTGITFTSATGVISGTTAQVGSFPVTLSATGAGVTVPVSLTLTVNPAATAPVITSASAMSTGAGASTTFDITASPAATSFAATDVGGTISLVNSGLTLNSVTNNGTLVGRLSGSVTKTPGTVRLSVTAANGAGSSAPTPLSITISPSGNAPVITSAVIVSGQVGVPLAYTLTSKAGVNGAVLTPGNVTYTVSGALPGGLTLDGAAGTVTGTPGAAGTYENIFFVGTNTTGFSGLGLEIIFNIAPAANVPVVNSNGTAAGQVGQLFSYTVTATNSPTSFAATGLPAGLSLNGTTGVISGVPSNATPGGTPAIVSLTATNGAGTSAAKLLLITVTSAPATPVITSAGTATGTVGGTFSFALTASQSPTSFAATGLPGGLSLNASTGVISGTPAAAGSFTATVRAANAAGLGAESSLAFTIAPASTAPAITSAAAASGKVGVAFNYQTAASPGTITGYAAASGTLPTGLILNSLTGVISGVPANAGTTTVSLTATGAGGTSLPQPLTITISPAGGAPVITSAGTATGVVGSNFTYTITASAVNTVTAFDAVNLPPGLGVNNSTGAIQGQPTTVGTTTAGLVATNDFGTSAIRDLVITVLPAAAAPVVTSGSAASAQVGVGFSYQITATNSPASFEVLGAPAWMTINSATGALAGTPTSPGSITVQLIASNSSGSSAPLALTLATAGAAGTPLVTSSRTASGTVGGIFSYPITTSPAATGYTVTGLPAGLSLNTGTATIGGAPTVSGTFNVVIVPINASGSGTPAAVVLTIAPSASLVVP